MSLKQIIEGWRNVIMPPEELKDIINKVSEERMDICNKCPFMSENAKAFSGYKTIRFDKHCVKCGCTLEAKTKSLSSECPLKKWEALVSQEEKYEIDKYINNENN